MPDAESGLRLTEYLSVLRKHWLLIAASALLVVGVAGAYSATASPQYRATAMVYVAVRVSGDSTASDLTQGSSYARQAVLSYTAVIESEIVLSRTIEELGLQESPEELAPSVEATSPSGSVLINVVVTRSDPTEAAAIANSVARNFAYVVETVIESPLDDTRSAVSITTIQTAKAPTRPVAPRTTLNLALGAVVGLLLGLGAAVMRDTLDTRIRSADDVRDALELPVLGQISWVGKGETTSLVTIEQPHSASAEDYRRLRTNLQFVNLDGKPHSFLITSSVAGEGKTTVACNLAITLAGTGAKVILIDGDMRNPSLGDRLGLDETVGLSDVLAHLIPLDSAMQSYTSTTLVVLPAGGIPPNPSELLSSNEMTRVHQTLANRFDYVVVDSPPVLAVSDAVALSGIVSTTLLVASAKLSRSGPTKAALAALTGIANGIGGVVLTGTRTRDVGTYGYRGGTESHRREA